MDHNGNGSDGSRSGKISVFIAEDKDVVRAGLRQLVGEISRCEVIGDSTSGEETIEKALAMNPRVILLKDKLPGIGICIVGYQL
ncbi:hypothetical protein [Acidovorax sp. BLS4]|uniref:hypothetical protein n=1 Tax=Acidovorax sp. BLS4 TaxID=3273430 RepID=UPI0029427E89|nr:hypothetical protein [Paracidovorax avenae]WOI45583.1 hypothetical protein R1Z03_24510 [Paracidovorax avenae]